MSYRLQVSSFTVYAIEIFIPKYIHVINKQLTLNVLIKYFYKIKYFSYLPTQPLWHGSVEGQQTIF